MNTGKGATIVITGTGRRDAYIMSCLRWWAARLPKELTLRYETGRQYVALVGELRTVVMVNPEGVEDPAFTGMILRSLFEGMQHELDRLQEA